MTRGGRRLLTRNVSRRRRGPTRGALLRGLLATLGLAVLAQLGAGWIPLTAWPKAEADAADATPPMPAASPEAAVATAAGPPRRPGEGRTVRHRVAPGDTLLRLFGEHALPEDDLAQLLAASPRALALRALRPGQTLELTLAEGRLAAVVLEGPEVGRLRFSRTERSYALSVAPLPEPSRASAAAAPAPRQVTVRPGDSLFAIFQRSGQPVGELARLLSTTPGAAELRRLKPGEVIEFPASPPRAGEADPPFRGFVYRPSQIRAVHYEPSERGYRRREIRREYERRTAHARAVIDSSLFAAADAAGLPDAITMQLVEIFGWDVDFALDIRTGDQLVVVYDDLFLDGRRVKPGVVLAAEFTNQGKAMRAFRYTEAGGRADYFDPSGERMRRAFIRTPVKFARISSRFTTRRRHPILHIMRAHRGVDYAAPRGTPVRATGDGRVELADRNGGYGKTIVLQHGGGYTTLYAHLARFAAGVRRGAHVRQGQVIGYVGSTGLATGPHLHYEFRIRGAHRDPLTVKLPRGDALPARERARFRAAIRPLLARLDSASRTRLAWAPGEEPRARAD